MRWRPGVPTIGDRPVGMRAWALAGALAAVGLPAAMVAAPVASAVEEQRVAGWIWPVGDGAVPRILEPFDPPPERWLAGHRGADLQSAPGAAVAAPAAGVVAFSGTVVDRSVVTIDHGNGLVSSFEPVRGTVAVGAGVAAGQTVGDVARGGHCANRCVHWGLRLHGEYIDPLNTVSDRRPSVLLPLPRDAPGT